MVKDYRALISKHRSAVMGLMALLIIVYHAKWETNSWIFNNTVNRYGSIGVDVFVFVSGFGLAYALTKSHGFGNYMKRRLTRILPAYYSFQILNLLVVLLLMAFGIENKLMQPIEAILPIGVWFNFDSNRNLAYKWYIAAIIGFYAIAAVIYPVMRKSRFLYLTVFIFLLITVCFIPFIADMSHMPFALQRLPALVLGLAVGVASLRKESKYRKTSIGMIGLFAAFAAGVIMIMLEGHVSGEFLLKMTDASSISLKQSLIAPLFTVFLTALFELMVRIHLESVAKCFAWLGKLSLELYLVHSIVSGILEITAMHKSIQVLLTVVISIPAAVMLRWLSGKVLLMWRKLIRHFVTENYDTMNLPE